MLFAKASSNFLVPNGTFVVELILFIIVLGIVAKFILPPVRKLVDEREARMRAALEASEAERSEADRLFAERLETIESARARAREILEEANRAGEQARDDARRRGGQEHERIVSGALARIETERAAIRAELVADLPTLVVAAAERVIGAQVEASRHASTIERARARAEETVR